MRLKKRILRPLANDSDTKSIDHRWFGPFGWAPPRRMLASMRGFGALLLAVAMAAGCGDSNTVADARLADGGGGGGDARVTDAHTADAAVLVGDASTDGPVSCEADLFEPNDDEGQADDLGTVGSDEQGLLSGSLHTVGDTDWYRFAGTDEIGAPVEPAIDSLTSTPLRVCMFFECALGTSATDYTCPQGTEHSLSPNGRPGCCSATGDSFAISSFNCTGQANDDATVFIRVDQGAACSTYSLTYRY